MNRRPRPAAALALAVIAGCCATGLAVGAAFMAANAPAPAEAPYRCWSAGSSRRMPGIAEQPCAAPQGAGAKAIVGFAHRRD